MRRRKFVLIALGLIGAVTVAAVSIHAHALPPIDAPPGTQTLVFGDSWTTGWAAPSHRGYAYLLGESMRWRTTVDGVAGTGYLNPGPKNEGTFEQRIDALPTSKPGLIIMQGGLNDAWQDRSNLESVAASTMHRMLDTHPGAALVVIGPAPSKLPVGVRLKDVDTKLKAAAADVGVHYISPIAEHWITTKNYAELIDTKAADHPSTAGHVYLARRVEADIKALR